MLTLESCVVHDALIWCSCGGAVDRTIINVNLRNGIYFDKTLALMATVSRYNG